MRSAGTPPGRARHGATRRRARGPDRQLARVGLPRPAARLVLSVAPLAHLVADAPRGHVRRERARGPARGVRDSRHWPGADRFAGVDWELGPFGTPLLADALASLECEIVIEHPAGDHLIVIGRVEDLRVAPLDDPLLFFAGAFSRGA